MARYNSNESLGFDAFDRAYEPEVMAYCNNISNGGVNSVCASNSIGTLSSLDGISLNTKIDNGINIVADGVVNVANNFDKLSKAIRKIAEVTGLEMDPDLNIIENNEGYSKTAYSNKLKLGGVSRLSRSQLLTI